MFEKFEILEKEKKWEKAINEIEKIIKNNPNNEEWYIRVIYFLHNYILEEFDHTSLNNIFEKKLLKYFNEWKEKFFENTSFLFFIWKILYIAEWYFGLDDDLKTMENKLAFKMQKKAFSLDSKNKLFKWALVNSKWDIVLANKLKLEILGNKSYIKWLESYWFPWNYVIESLNFNY